MDSVDALRPVIHTSLPFAARIQGGLKDEEVSQSGKVMIELRKPVPSSGETSVIGGRFKGITNHLY